MTALEELWYGNIDPYEAILQDDKQFKNLLSLMGKNRDKLTDTLTEQQKETLEKYDAAINEMHSLSELSAFRYGFSLGVRLMMESISIQLTNEDQTIQRGSGFAFLFEYRAHSFRDQKSINRSKPITTIKKLEKTAFYS